MKIYHSFSSAGTRKFAKSLAGKITGAVPSRRALIIALTGELGSGKTTFVQGFFQGLGTKKKIFSPTFILMRRTALRKKGFKSTFHIDCYRIKKPKELLQLGFKEIIRNPGNIVLIEWADKIKKILPKNAVWLEFEHGGGKDERSIKIQNLKISAEGGSASGGKNQNDPEQIASQFNGAGNAKLKNF